MQWKLALNMLEEYDTYGCNSMFDIRYSKNMHYSGNFWWATSNHIKKLPKIIESYYCAPEDWICTKNDKMISIFSSNFESGQHYNLNYDAFNYVLPINFNIYAYKYCNDDLKNLDYSQLIKHYLLYGKNENRICSMPMNFDFIFYKNAYFGNIKISDKKIVKHWFEKGKLKNLKYNLNRNIIGYFHIFQKEGWKKSFDLIFSKIKESNLYENTIEIRIGIVNDLKYIEDDERLKDKKIKIIFHKSSLEYERPTLYHMKESSYIDENNTLYWYCHTKGIRHFNTEKETYIIDWINLLSYWNFTKWKYAIYFLKEFDTYGCNAILNKIHYSGNFWWATSKHIQKLPFIIPDYYTAPENWVCTINNKMFNIFSCNINPYNNNFPKEIYDLPKDFNMFRYKKLNNDLKNLSMEEIIPHYIYHGKKEGRKYK